MSAAGPQSSVFDGERRRGHTHMLPPAPDSHVRCSECEQYSLRAPRSPLGFRVRPAPIGGARGPAHHPQTSTTPSAQFSAPRSLQGRRRVHTLVDQSSLRCARRCAGTRTSPSRRRARESPHQRCQRTCARPSIAARADKEHRLWMQGDERGFYGQYPPHERSGMGWAGDHRHRPRGAKDPSQCEWPRRSIKAQRFEHSAGEVVSGNEIANPEIAKWDPGFTKQLINVVTPVIKRWFRAEVRGLGILPASRRRFGGV